MGHLCVHLGFNKLVSEGLLGQTHARYNLPYQIKRPPHTPERLPSPASQTGQFSLIGFRIYEQSPAGVCTGIYCFGLQAPRRLSDE